ncbi:MAG: murein L,D-transpeptidase catalytic domain family protein [Gammaproteobacteria bacterium]|nr:murein L,D-transpeptidase catalytic domain family protein [Gammaproteobacteria bacterium]
MKKFIVLSLLFFISNNVLAAKATVLDIKAKNISTKTTNLKPSVVKLAMRAFYNSKRLGVRTKKPIITVIDYSLPSTKERLWVVDIEQEKILYSSMVAHGKYSGENHTTSFSNRVGSLQTSIGLFLTEGTYFGQDGYSLYMQGLEKGFNDNAKVRTIVFHGAPYVSKQFANAAGRIGRSWGCPAVEKHLAKPIINTIKDGTLIFAFYPDRNWLSNSKFINQSA